MPSSDKDLFRALFSRVSQHSYDTYRRLYLERLPLLLLQSAYLTTPAIATCAGYVDLLEHLQSSSADTRLWRNAELFPYLNYVAFPMNSKRQACIDALRVHCRLAQLTRKSNPDVRHWRLRHELSTSNVEVVWFEEDLAVRRLDLGWIFSAYERAVAVFRPHPGLFDDVEPKLYGAQSCLSSNEELNRLLREAFFIVDRYSHSLCVNILDQVSTISLLKAASDRPVSFSLRNRFIGAVFVTIASPIEIAEQLIHEYYHQCMWPWWLIEPPKDLPDENSRVLSPVSGALRSLPTMVQAILIYSSLQDFYTFAIEQIDASSNHVARDRAIARATTIRERFGDLTATVVDQLGDMKATKSLVGAILDLRKEALLC